MAVRDGFWNSMVGDVRTYYNTDFSHILSLLIKDGVYQNYGQALITIPGEGLQVIVQQGEAWFDEHWIRNDSDLQVAIDAAPIVAGYSRIDAIAIKVDSTPSLEGRHVTIDYIQGTAGTEPVAPELIDTDLIKYHLLCTVTVSANATSITQANITNYIGTETTPFISGILETIDSSVLLAQWSAQFTEFMQDNETEFDTWMLNQQSIFTTWFESIRDQLDEDAAGHLQLEIDELKKGTGVFYETDDEAEADIDNIEEGATVYTNDGEDEPINARQIRYDDGTQIGSDVETQIKALYQMIEELGGGSMPTLDYTNYLHIFTSSAPSDIPSGATYGLSFTANKDCYLHGVYLPYNNKLTINGKEMCSYTASSGFIPVTWKLSAGDIVTVQGAVSCLYVLSEK